MFFGLLIYGYILLKISNKTFTGPTNVNDVTPNYAHNGFKFWIVTLVIFMYISTIFPNFPKLFTMNFITFIMTSNIFGFLFV